MAGTLTITTLSDGTNSTSTTNCIQGSAKAWCNWNGTTGTIRASYNVSSITVVSTGTYLINFTNAFADTNYAATVSGGTGAGNTNNNNSPGNSTPTTSAFPVQTFDYAFNLANWAYNYAAFYR